MCAEGWPSPERGLGHGRGTEGDGQGRQGAHEMWALVREGAATLGPWGGPCPAPCSSWAPRGRSELGVPGVTWAEAPGTSPRAQREGRWHPGHLTPSLPPPRVDLRRVPPPPHPQSPRWVPLAGNCREATPQVTPKPQFNARLGLGSLEGRAPPTLPPDGVSVAAAHTQVGGAGCGTSVRAAGSGGVVRGQDGGMTRVGSQE